jgi:uncharacterized protein YidB (DUF937 family)
MAGMRPDQKMLTMWIWSDDGTTEMWRLRITQGEYAMGIFSWIILGLIAGFIGSKIVDKQGQGFWLNIALGIIGALVGGFLFSFFGSSGVTGLDLWSMIVAIAGSVVVLLIYNAVTGRRSAWTWIGESDLQTQGRKMMAGLEDMIRSSAPGGNVGKPLMLALLALLASGALFRSGGGERPADTPPQPKSDEGAGGLLGGLGGLLDKLQKGGLGNAANSWVGSGQNQPASPGQLGSALGPEIIKILAQRSGLSEEDITKQLSQVLPGVVDKLTPQGRLPTVAELSELRWIALPMGREG